MIIEENTIEIVLKPCPWCNQTPDLILPIDDRENTDGTWLWKIRCNWIECRIKPISPYVSIRKTTKNDIYRLNMKLERLAYMWNNENPRIARDKKRIEIKKIIKE